MRSMWKGSLSFGLVNIPVQLYTASREKQLSFTMLHKKDMSKIRYARICQVEGKEVPWNEIVKGYEQEDGNYVIMDDADFAKASLKKTQTIEILGFIDEDEIDTIYYEKPYFLEPGKNADKAYILLREALRKSGKVGLAKYILRNHEHLAVVKAHGNLLVLNDLRFEDEIVDASELKVPGNIKPEHKELEMALKLIDHLATPFKPAAYHDTYTEEIKAIIKQKSKGKKVHPKEKAADSPKVHDIMGLLQASLKEDSEKKTKKKPRKSA